jgi:hypothetical protein
MLRGLVDSNCDHSFDGLAGLYHVCRTLPTNLSCFYPYCIHFAIRGSHQ